MSAKVDYAVRACVELAIAAPTRSAGPTKGDTVGEAQDIPKKYLENILSELRRSGIVGSQRGADGGYWMARPASDVTVADIIRAVEGPLADVRGEPPGELDYIGAARPLERVWVAARASLRSVLENVTVADIAHDQLPDAVQRMLEDPDVWERR